MNPTTPQDEERAMLAHALDRAAPRLAALAREGIGPRAWRAELQALGWVWPPDDELPLARGELLAQVGLSLGREGLLAQGAGLHWCDAVGEAGGPRAARLACHALVVGTLRWLLAATVEHARTRQQFGQSIGGFQAVQHRVVDMLVATELAEALLLDVAREPDDASLDVLQLQLAGAARCVTQGAIQMHGAIALSAELPMSSAWAAVESALTRHGSTALAAARGRQRLWDRAREGG